MNRLYRENGFDPNTLEDAIKNNLNLQEVSYDKLSINDKRKGNLRRFFQQVLLQNLKSVYIRRRICFGNDETFRIL